MNHIIYNIKSKETCQIRAVICALYWENNKGNMFESIYFFIDMMLACVKFSKFTQVLRETFST